MPKLSPLTAEQVIRKLRNLGFEGSGIGARHSRMVHIATGKIIPLPIQGSKDVSISLVPAIIREAGIIVDEWLEF